MRRSHALRLAVLAAAGMLILSACSPRAADTDDEDAAPGITDDSVLIGGTMPLSGPAAANGVNQIAGMEAFFEKVNEEGGVPMADGITRTVEFKYYDDGFDPARSVQNFRRLVDQDQVFATIGAFGTGNNMAIRPVAEELEVPQVFVNSGGGELSADRTAHPWTLGWNPSFETEGAAFAEYLVGLDRPITAAFIGQNDDQGEAFRKGFMEGIEGSQVTLVAEATYEPTDVTVESQISQLAASGAEAFMSAAALPYLSASALNKMIELQWLPITYVPSTGADPRAVIEPSGIGDVLDELYTGAALRDPCAPDAENDPVVADYLDTLETYNPDADPCAINTVFGYAAASTLVQTLELTATPTRLAFLDAVKELRSENVAMVLDGIWVDGSDTGLPAVGSVLLRKWDGTQWAGAE